jgi:peptidoglycan/xylan/chitin deacetylase (PgdA/CDA1 family)
MYMITNALDKKDYLTTEQCQTLLADGWEFGSHSQSHLDLARNSNKNTLFSEVTRSKAILADKLGVEIRTFAYPYGSRDGLVEASVKYSGYVAGMGLGLKVIHRPKDLFYLSRVEIKSTTTIAQFQALLPWK